MCHCSDLYHVYNYNYNNNYLFVITICLQPFCKEHLFVFLLTQLFYKSSQRRPSNHDCFVHTQLHTRLTGFLLIIVNDQSNEPSWSRSFSFSPSQELYRDHIVILFIRILVFLSCLLLVVYVFDGFVSMYLYRV